MEANEMTPHVEAARGKGFEVDESDRIIYYDYLTPEDLEDESIAILRSQYNFRCQALIIQ